MLKVGQRVKVKDKSEMPIGSMFVYRTMGMFCNKIVTISNFQEKSFDTVYFIKEANTPFLWTEDMFHKIESQDKIETILRDVAQV